MLRILLIRHGNTDLLGRVLYGRMPGIHVNEQGRRQADATARVISRRYTIDAVISSPMERAIETAHFIADPLGLEISVEEGFNEIDFGAWKGLAFSELAAMDDWKHYNNSRSTSRPPGGESMIEVQARSWAAIQRVAERFRDYPEATAAIVTHGDIVRALLLLLLGMPIDHIHRIEASPASVSEIILDGISARVRTMNETFEWV